MQNLLRDVEGADQVHHQHPHHEERQRHVHHPPTLQDAHEPVLRADALFGGVTTIGQSHDLRQQLLFVRRHLSTADFSWISSRGEQPVFDLMELR